MGTSRTSGFLLGIGAALLAGILAAGAYAAMSSERLDRNLCQTTGGGRNVAIPGFPGESIDRRLLSDIALLERRYKVFITDGQSDDPVHAANGEHPLGLALDIVPNAAAGGTWRDISALARWAEPRQDQPIAPFRWVGYDGDSGHGRGHHLHLSWDHSETRPGVPPATVYTMRCPGTKVAAGGGGGAVEAEPLGGEQPSKGGGPSGVGAGLAGGSGGSGGVQPGSASSGSVGIGATRSAAGAPVVETGGVGRS